MRLCAYGQHLAERMDLEPGRVAALDLRLERRAEAGNLVRSCVRRRSARARVPELRAEAAQVVAAAPGAMVEARHVDVLAADAAVVPRGRAYERGQVAAHVEPDLLAEVAADHVRSVADAVRVRRRLRVEQDARRVDAARAQDDDLPAHLLLGAGPSIEVLHASREAASRRSGCAPPRRSSGSRACRSASRTAAGDRPSRRTTPCRSPRRSCRSSGTAGKPRVGRVMLARRPATTGMPSFAIALCSSRSPQRGAGGGCRNLLPGSASESSVAAADADELLDLVVVGRDVLCRGSARGSPSRRARRP